MAKPPSSAVWLFREGPTEPFKISTVKGGPYLEVPGLSFTDELQPGQQVFLWHSLPDGGLFAIGRISSSTRLKGAIRRVKVEQQLDPALPEDEIRKELPKLPIFHDRPSGPAAHRIDPSAAAILEEMVLEFTKRVSRKRSRIKTTKKSSRSKKTGLKSPPPSSDESSAEGTSNNSTGISTPWGDGVSEASKLVLDLAAFYANNKYRNKNLLSSTCLLFALVDLVVIAKQLENTPAERITHLLTEKAGKRYDDLAKQYLNRRIDVWEDQPRGPINEVRLTSNFKATLKRASSLAQQTHHDLPEPEHLVAGALAVEGLLQRRLQEMGLYPGDWRTELREDLSKKFPDRVDEWNTLFPDIEPVERTTELDPVNHIALLDADSTENRDDKLQIQQYVDAFARVIASDSLKPPLSIGLFGDWGSGKTFFMNLLEKKVSDLACQAENDQSLPYHTRICQIRFNAWHYAEVNLWASLVSTIFRKLQKFLDGPKDKQQGFEKLLKQLKIVEQLYKEAQKQKDEAEKKYDRTVNNLKKAQKELADIKPPESGSEEYDKLLKQGLKAALKDGLGNIGIARQAIAQLADFLDRKDLKEQAGKLNDDIVVKDAREVIDGARAITRRADFWLRAMAATKLHRSPIFWLVVLVAVALPIWALCYTPDATHALARGLTTVLVDVLVLGGSVLAWMKSRLRKASGWFDQIDQLQVNVEGRVEEARYKDRRKHEDEVKRNQHETEIARRSLENAEREEREQREIVEEARANLRNSSSQARLARFIRERAAEADYEKHLGIIAAIHDDFRTLSRLLRNPKSAGGRQNDEMPTLHRIVLYIDDLDRCPAGGVVRVLEAVHLMLAFPLFVVVVGVDSRWVSRALNKHYKEMLYDETIVQAAQAGTFTNRSSTTRPPAQSQDYLEKIFQVPFWLRRLEPKAVQRLIESLLPEEQIDRDWSKTPTGENPPASGDNGTDELTGAADANQEDTVAGTQTNDETENELEPTDAQKVQQQARQLVAEAEESVADLAGPEAVPAESLRITLNEREFMDKVAPLMPRSPRSVKRFVNIYRLYKAALSKRGLERFLGSPDYPGNYRAVQVLLALVTGAPRLARAVYDELNDSESVGRLDELVRRLKSRDLEMGKEGLLWDATLKALETFILNPYHNLTLNELRHVAPLVGRYSVHHMLSDAPGLSEQLG